MPRALLFPAALLTLLVVVLAAGSLASTARSNGLGGRPYEVWLIDQADTTADGGGTLHIYDGAALAADPGRARAETIDLGGAARTLCLEQTGSAPRRPHMFFFNAGHTHVVLAFVASGHVLIMDGPSRRPLACIDAGEQAHAAVPSADGTFAIVANQNGKLLQRIRTDYARNVFTLEDAATINLATCKTPSGADCQSAALRPDNAPICALVESTSRLAFVTLRGGGLFVVDAAATPMQIVAEYDREAVQPNGCGGVEAGGKVYLNSGGGTPATPFAADLYAFPNGGYLGSANPPNWPPRTRVFTYTGSGPVDSHGATVVNGGSHIWVADRNMNKIVAVSIGPDRVVGEIDLAGAHSNDPAPDLLDVSPTGDRVFAALRGPSPLTGNAPMANNAVGATPGLAVLRVEVDGRSGTLTGVARVSRMVEGTERADPHGVGVRRK